MKKGQVWPVVGQIALLGVFVLLVVVVFQAARSGGVGGAPTGIGTAQGYPPPGTEVMLLPATVASIPPYPAPEQTPLIEPTLSSVPIVLTPEPPPIPETPPLLTGKAATLYQGNIWLMENSLPFANATDVGDVAAIFGWNMDGTMLLFGRGRVKQAEFVGDTTELWIFDMNTRQVRQLTTGSQIKSAAWSPVDNRIAYCELGDVLTVVTLEGEKLQQLERAICAFTWSPDGLAISLSTYTPDMIDSDGLKYTVLAVWWLSNDQLQVFSDAKDESQYWSVWSVDSKRILFVRDYHEPSKQELSGLNIADIASGQIQRLEGKTVSAEELTRSPRADLVAYRIGPDVFVTDFEGQSQIIGQGRSLLWLPDGKTLIYRALDGKFQVATFDAQVLESATGGQRFSANLYIQPEYFFAPGG